MTLLPMHAFIVTTSNVVTWHIEAHLSAVVFAQSQSHEFVFRRIVVEFARRTGIQQKGQTEWVSVAVDRLPSFCFWIQTIDYNIVDFSRNQDDRGIDVGLHCEMSIQPICDFLTLYLQVSTISASPI